MPKSGNFSPAFLGSLSPAATEKEDWYFSIEDFISFLTDCANSDEYIEEMLSRDESLAFNWNTICVTVQMSGENEQIHEVQAVNTQGLFRIIQSIP